MLLIINKLSFEYKQTIKINNTSPITASATIITKRYIKKNNSIFIIIK